jgi:hypothetical protein
MGECDNQLVNHPILPDGTGHGLYLNVIGPVADKVIAVEALNLSPASSSRQGRNMS